MKIDLVFWDWRRLDGKPDDMATCEASMRDFHGGTTFRGTIDLDEEQAEDLRESLAKGLVPHFWIQEREGDRASDADPIAAAWESMAKAQAKLLVAYRLGDQRRGGAAVDAVGKARDRLVTLCANVEGI